MIADRADHCAACGKPTYVGEDFAGPCVHSTDLACATFERDYARRETATLRERMLAEANDHERWGNHLVASTLRRLATP